MQIKTIMNSICTALSEKFPDTAVYAEPVTQGLVRPCILVAPQALHTHTTIAARDERILRIRIRAIPGESDTDYTALLTQCDGIFSALRAAICEGIPLPPLTLDGQIDPNGELSVQADFGYLAEQTAPAHASEMMDGIALSFHAGIASAGGSSSEGRA